MRAVGNQPAVGQVFETHRLTRELNSCGWHPAPSGVPGEALAIQAGGRVASIFPCIFHSESGKSLLLIGLPHVGMPHRDTLYRRFLNLAMESRLALSLARRCGHTDWVLIATEPRLDLYRTHTETCEVCAEQPEDVERVLLPWLSSQALGRGRLPAGRHGAAGETDALRSWLELWRTQLAEELQLPLATVDCMLWRWLLMLQLDRLAGDAEAERRWGIHWRDDDGRKVITYDAPTATDDLCHAQLRFGEHFSSRIFELDLDRLFARLRAIEETATLDRFRAELLMQTADRLEAEHVAWLFTDLDREQAGWRREVGGSQPPRASFLQHQWVVQEPLRLDLGQFGLTAALVDLGRLAEHIAHQELYFRRLREFDPASPVEQPDLFRERARQVGPQGELIDPINFILEQALRFENVRPGDRLGLTVVMLLKLMRLANDYNWPLCWFKAIDHAFPPEENPA